MSSWLRLRRPYTPSNADNVKMDSLWRVNHSFRLHVQSASRVNVKDVDLIYVRVGLYHGTEPLCPEKQSKQVKCVISKSIFLTPLFVGKSRRP